MAACPSGGLKWKKLIRFYLANVLGTPTLSWTLQGDIKVWPQFRPQVVREGDPNIRTPHVWMVWEVSCKHWVATCLSYGRSSLRATPHSCLYQCPMCDMVPSTHMPAKHIAQWPNSSCSHALPLPRDSACPHSCPMAWPGFPFSLADCSTSRRTG